MRNTVTAQAVLLSMLVALPAAAQNRPQTPYQPEFVIAKPEGAPPQAPGGAVAAVVPGSYRIGLQDEIKIRPWLLVNAGIRHDRYQRFSRTTPRGAVIVMPSANQSFKYLYGRAFRAPAFLESYGITNPVALGNPDLKPETNNTLETAFSWLARPDTQLNLTVYRYAMSNIIRTVPNAIANTGATYRNTGDQNGHGLEFESVLTVNKDLRLMANYSWQHSVDKASGKDAGYAPHHHLYVRADWQFARDHLIGAQLNHVAKRLRPAGDTRPPVADYTTLDLSLRSELGRGRWDFTATVRNLFGADAREPSPGPGLQLPFDLPLAPRAFSLQASYRL